MQAINLKRFTLVILLALIALSARTAKAGPPTEQLRQTAEKVLSILQDPQLKSPDKTTQRRGELRQVISTRFDFQEMAKRSLGRHWQRISRDEQRQFVKLFTDLLERSYTDKIEAFDGEKIVFGRENQSSDHAEVDTKIVTTKGESFSVNYKLRPTGGEWKVYDVVIEDVSLVNNYRSQFSRLLANTSFQEFLRKLEEQPVDAPGKDGTRPRRVKS